MGLFGISAVSENATFTPEYSYLGEASELTEIMFEAAKDIAQIQGGLYVADIMMESQVLFEGASAEVLLEGVVKDYFGKIIEAFKKLWNKIKSWFQQVYKALEVFFLPGEKFVKKYATELHQKDATGFTYKGYKWAKSDITELYSLKNVEKLEVPTYSSIDGLYQAAEINPNSENKVTATEVKAAQEAILKEASNGKAENVSEFKALFMEGVTGGEKEEIENFSVYSITEMIDFIKGNKKLQTGLKKAEASMNKSCNNVIKGMENLRKSLSTEDQAKYSASINNCASIARYEVSIATTIVECTITVAKKQNSEFVSVLKSLMRYKGTKEGFGYMNENKSASLLEAAMGLI